MFPNLVIVMVSDIVPTLYFNNVEIESYGSGDVLVAFNICTGW